MRLEQLYPDILSMSPSELQIHMIRYSEKREKDLLTPIPFQSTAKKKSSPGQARDKKVNVTPEQLQLLKLLGLV